MMALMAVAILAFAFGGALAWWWHRRLLCRRQKRVERLSDDLARVLKGEAVPLFQVEEDDLARLADGLTKTVARLAASERSAALAREKLADDLADISHQLKTPIAGLKILLEHIETKAAADQKPLLQQAGRSLRRLETLVETLLVLARLDAASLPIKSEAVSGRRIVEEAAELAAPLFEQKGQHLSIKDDGADLYWRGDPYWSTEILLNLLKNASEHSPQGSVVAVHLRATALYSEIDVRDAGPGLSAADRGHVFERFYKGAGASEESVGIGLALARELALAQNGSLRAGNAPQGGALFQLRFPSLS